MLWARDTFDVGVKDLREVVHGFVMRSARLVGYVRRSQGTTHHQLWHSVGAPPCPNTTASVFSETLTGWRSKYVESHFFPSSLPSFFLRKGLTTSARQTFDTLSSLIDTPLLYIVLFDSFDSKNVAPKRRTYQRVGRRFGQWPLQGTRIHQGFGNP